MKVSYVLLYMLYVLYILCKVSYSNHLKINVRRDPVLLPSWKCYAFFKVVLKVVLGRKTGQFHYEEDEYKKRHLFFSTGYFFHLQQNID